MAQMSAVHPTVAGAEDFAYQMWPIEEAYSWKEIFGTLKIPKPHWRKTKSSKVKFVEVAYLNYSANAILADRPPVWLYDASEGNIAASEGRSDSTENDADEMAQRRRDTNRRKRARKQEKKSQQMEQEEREEGKRMQRKREKKKRKKRNGNRKERVSRRMEREGRGRRRRKAQTRTSDRKLRREDGTRSGTSGGVYDSIQDGFEREMKERFVGVTNGVLSELGTSAVVAWKGLGDQSRMYFIL